MPKKDKIGFMNSKEEPKKSKVYAGGDKMLLQTSKGMFPISILGKHEIKKTSKQLRRERQFGIKELIPPPYDPSSFLLLSESNPIFAACVSQIASDVAGLGYRLILREGEKEDKKEKTKITEFLDRPNPDQSLREVLKALLTDWGTIGYWGMEVVMNKRKEVAEIYAVPAHTFRIHKDEKKYCQQRNGDKKWFSKFEEDLVISAKTGEKGDYSLEDRGSKFIYYKNYFARSDYYGVPNILSAVGSVVGLLGIRDYNLSFFENYGVPAALIVLKGNWSEDAPKIIKNFLDTEIKGSQNAHKTMVFKVEEGDSFEYKPLTSEKKEGSFLIQVQGLRDDVLIVYSMPAGRLGLHIVGKLAGNIEEEATRIYNQSVVEPLQADLESIINNKLLKKGLNCNKYEFKFNDLDIRDLTAEVERYKDLFAMGSITPNQIRRLMDLGKSYAGGDKYYISGTFVEVGGEELEKRQDKFIGAMEDFKKGLKKVIEEE